MENVYQKSDLKYSEIVTAIDDFTYGQEGKFYLAPVTPFVPPKLNAKGKNGILNIMNKFIPPLGIGWWFSTGGIYLKVPVNLWPKCAGAGGGDNIQHVSSDGAHVRHVGCGHHGSKGTKFTVTFIEGDIKKCKIVGRYEK